MLVERMDRQARRPYTASAGKIPYAWSPAWAKRTAEMPSDAARTELPAISSGVPSARSSYDPNPCQAAMRSRNRSFRGFLSCNGCGIFGECRCGRVLQHETCGHPCPFSYPRIPCICTARTSMFRLGGGGTVWMRACRHGRCIQFQASLPPGSRARRARAQRHSWSGE